MEVSQAEKLPSPPGIINSIKAGFDIIATHLTAILFPLLLNLFFWLGPRLSLMSWFNLHQAEMVAFWKLGGASPEDIQRALDLYTSTLPSFNLFWMLRAIPVGISSLLFPFGDKTPLGAYAVLQVTDLNLPGWIFLLTLVGWLCGGLYFRAVARLALDQDAKPIGVPRALLQTVLLSITWIIIFMMVTLPLLFIVAILSLLSPVLAQIFILVISFISMWVIVPLFFWAHGIFLKKQNVITSMLSSLQMVRFTLPSSSMFVLTVFLLSFGLNYLWSIPPMDSWVTLLGIFGQSFVSTALLAASFIYYRDMNNWLQAMLEKLNANRAGLQVNR